MKKALFSLVFSVFFFGTSCLFGAPGAFLATGSLAPVVELKDLSGNPQTVPASGSWSIVFYWSLFCHSCIEEMPIISDEIMKLKETPVKSFFISLDTERMKKGVENFLKKRNLALNVLLEEIVSESYKSADMWGVKTTPSAFLVDPRGHVVFSKEGPFDPETMLKILRCGLASGTASGSADCDCH